MYGTEKEKHLGGYWNVKTSLCGDPGTWSPLIWNKIIKQLDIKSVADIGCGLGYSTRYFAQKGLDSVGVEGGVNAINNSIFEGIILHNDYTKSNAFTTQKFDLIWCCEFVEHVEEQYCDNFLNDFTHGKYIAMTYAEPGQASYHHVNCQKQEYWIEKIEKLGYKLNQEFTNELRDIAIETNSGKSSFVHVGHLQKLLLFEKVL